MSYDGPAAPIPESQGGRQAVASGYQSARERSRSRSNSLRFEAPPQPPTEPLPPVPTASTAARQSKPRGPPPALSLAQRSPSSRQLTDPPLSPSVSVKMGMGATLSPHTASFPRSPSPLSPNAAKGRQPLSPIQVPSYAQAMNDPLCSPIGSESRYPAPPSPSYQARKNALHSPSMETLVGSASGHGHGFGTAKKSDGFDIFGGIPVSYEPKRAPTTRWSMDSADEKSSAKTGNTKNLLGQQVQTSSWLSQQRSGNKKLKIFVWFLAIAIILGAVAAVVVHYYKPPNEKVTTKTSAGLTTVNSTGSSTDEAPDPSNTQASYAGFGGGGSPDGGSKRRRGLHVVMKH